VLRPNTRGRDGSVRQELATGVTEVAIAGAPLYHRLMTNVKSSVSKKFGMGVAVLALAGAVGAGLTEVVKEASESTVRQTISWGQEKIEQLFPSALPQADKNAAFSIFMAKLGDDPDGSQTKVSRSVVASMRLTLSTESR
jgi:hypothetical protein